MNEGQEYAARWTATGTGTKLESALKLGGENWSSVGAP